MIIGQDVYLYSVRGSVGESLGELNPMRRLVIGILLVADIYRS